MQNQRTYGTRVGTRGALGFRSRLNSTAKTAFRALAIGVMVVGAFAFARTTDASPIGDPSAPTGQTIGTYLGFFPGNTVPTENVQDVLDNAGGFGILALTFYSKQDYGTPGFVVEQTNATGVLSTLFNTDPPANIIPDDPICQSGFDTCGSWAFATPSPFVAGPLVTLLAIKADGFFGLWLYNDIVANIIDPADQHGLFDATELYTDIGFAPEISHISVFGDLAIIPLPAALPLFLTALAGLGGMTYRRRRKQALATA